MRVYVRICIWDSRLLPAQYLYPLTLFPYFGRWSKRKSGYGYVATPPRNTLTLHLIPTYIYYYLTTTYNILLRLLYFLLQLTPLDPKKKRISRRNTYLQKIKGEGKEDTVLWLVSHRGKIEERGKKNNQESDLKI